MIIVEYLPNKSLHILVVYLSSPVPSSSIFANDPEQELAAYTWLVFEPIVISE